MSKWRPDNWNTVNTWMWMPDGHHVSAEAAKALYELGADAMLDAILPEARTFMDTYDWRRFMARLGME